MLTRMRAELLDRCCRESACSDFLFVQLASAVQQSKGAENDLLVQKVFAHMDDLTSGTCMLSEPQRARERKRERERERERVRERERESE